MEPAFLEIRQGQDRSVTMSCRVLRAYPIRVLTYEWRLGSKLLRTGQFDSQEYTEYPVKSLSNENYGVYNCSIINEAGAGRCSFLVTGKMLNILHFFFLDLGSLGLCQYKNESILQIHGAYHEQLDCSYLELLLIYFQGKSILVVKIVNVPIKLEVYVNSNRVGDEVGYTECFSNKVTNLN